MARNTSTAYVQQLKQSRKHCAKVIITYTDGTSDTLTELKDFMKLKVEDACSGTSEFEIGAAIINEAVVTLNNRTGKFKDKSFFGASVTIYTGIYVDGVPELLKMGTYIVDEPVAPGATINLVAFDNMVKADKQYVPGIVYPATNAQIAEDACSQCGLVLKNLDFPNSDYIVNAAPEESYTCREILSLVAQMGACFARCDVDGQVEIRWYEEEVTHEVSELRSKDICTDVVTVTGIDVLAGSETIATSGEEGYKLAIKDNVLIQEGDEQLIADFLAGKLVGLSFRPLAVTCRSDASIEAGDKVRVTDEKGNNYETLVTSTTFTMMSAQKVECNAASPVINSSNRLSETAKAIIASKKYTQILVNQEKTAREKALEEMSKRITESSGLYVTTEVQEDGSTIYYGHDKAKLEDSTIIWKFGLEAIGISTDGGKTYPYGFDISGTATLSRIYAVGINADYITSGTFVAKDSVGKIVFSVNVDTGEVLIDAGSVKMSSGKTLTEEMNAMDNKINSIDGIFFFIRYSANADGSNMTESPQDDTLYMGTCSTNVDAAPTDPAEYTWCKVKGANGINGKEILIEYAVSDSPTIPPSESSVAVASETASVKYSTSAVLGEAVLGYMVLGSTGGTAANKLATPTIYIEYSIWSTIPPERGEGQYIWQRITYILPDGSIEVGTPVCITGDKGDDGISGVGIKSVKEYYAVSTSSSETPTEWQETMPELTVTNKYLWNYEIITYTDDTTTETTAGVIGVFGNDGKGVKEITEYYAVSADSTAVPIEWKPTVPTLTSENKYLWNYEKVVFTDGTETTTEPGVIGAYGDTGAAGRDAVTYRIESTLGVAFLDTQADNTTLTARMYKGAAEVDSAGAYGYTWYLVAKDGTESTLGTGKTISLSTSRLAGMGVYFVADDGGVEEEMVQLDTPVIYLEYPTKLETPVIYLQYPTQLDTPVIELKEE